MSASLNEYFTDWVFHRMSTSLNGYFTEWVPHWTSTLLNEYFTDWALLWMSISLNEYFTEWVLRVSSEVLTLQHATLWNEKITSKLPVARILEVFSITSSFVYFDVSIRLEKKINFILVEGMWVGWHWNVKYRLQSWIFQLTERVFLWSLHTFNRSEAQFPQITHSKAYFFHTITL